jgi:hypothetical protein
LVSLVILKRNRAKAAKMTNPITTAPTNQTDPATPQQPTAAAKELYELLALSLLEWSGWVHRRTERIEMLDEARLRHVTSIEFTPYRTGIASGKEDSVLVPFILARKQLRQGFSLRDETGCLVPIKTRAESLDLLVPMMLSLAEELIAKIPADKRGAIALDEPLRCEIRTLVESDEAPTRSTLQKLRTWKTSPRPTKRWLWAQIPFRKLLLDLSSNYVLFAELEKHLGKRRILEMTEETIMRHRYHNLFRVYLLQAALCQSYYAEVRLPGKLLFRSARLEIGPKPVENIVSPYSLMWRRDMVVMRIDNLEPGRQARLTMNIGLERDGILTSALLMTSTSAVLALLAVWLHAWQGVSPVESVAAPVVVVLPAVFAAFLVAQGEHPLVSWFSLRIRLFVYIAALAAFILAASLAVNFDSWSPMVVFGHDLAWRPLIWVLAGCIETLMSILLGVEWWASRLRSRF